MKRNFWILSIVVLVGVGSAWLGIVRSRARISAEHSERAAEFATASHEGASVAIVAPSETEAYRAGIEDAVRDADLIRMDEKRLSATVQAQLVETVGGFLAMRFGGASPDAYWQWREAQGYLLRESEEMIDLCLVDAAYEELFDRPLPEGVPWRELHAQILAGYDTFRGGRSRLVGIASDRRGWSVVCKRLTLADPDWPNLDGLVGSLLYAGDVTATTWPWHAPPFSSRERLIDRGELLVCNIGFLGRFGDGALRPVVLSMIWDDERGRWWILSLATGAPLGDRPGTIKEAAGMPW